MTKALNIVKNLITYIVIAVAVCMMIFTVASVTMFDRIDRSIFGYRAFIVRTDSMSATDFSAGDLILTRKVDDPSTLKEGDIITFQSTDPYSYGEIITHKIRNLTTDADGNPGFVTYGTTTNTNDGTVVTYNFVLGEYKAALPGVGRFFEFLRTPMGYISCIMLPFLLFILLQAVNSVRLFKQYKREQVDAIEAERSQMEAERLESQRMKEELLKLKAELVKQADAVKTDKTAETLSIQEIAPLAKLETCQPQNTAAPVDEQGMVHSDNSAVTETQIRVIEKPVIQGADTKTKASSAKSDASQTQVFRVRRAARDISRPDNKSNKSGDESKTEM